MNKSRYAIARILDIGVIALLATALIVDEPAAIYIGASLLGLLAIMVNSIFASDDNKRN